MGLKRYELLSGVLLIGQGFLWGHGGLSQAGGLLLDAALVLLLKRFELHW
jgi:hypothetical protein